MTAMPMFPLGAVLLPGEVMPLQVFEPRYLVMLGECLARPEPEFGVVMIERGSEVGGGDQRSMAGTVARVAQARPLLDGRLALVTIGVRRVRVERWLDDDPYPEAEVIDWPDDTSGDHEADLDAARAKVRRVLALANELGHASKLDLELSASPTVASYQLAAAVPLGVADRHRLLCAAGPVERLALLDAALDDVEAMLRFRLANPPTSGDDDRTDQP